MMGAYAEFQQAGRLGPGGAKLLYATVAAVARIHRFPPPSGQESWTKDDIESVAHDFLTSENAERRLAQLFISAVDEEAFARLLGTAVLNHLRSEARRTMIGRLIRRLNDVLAGSSGFRRIERTGESWWTLAEGVDEPVTAPADALVAAAAEVREVKVPRWSETARRQAPHADRDSLERLARRVLEVAGGSLAVSELARAVAPRLGLGAVPLVTDIDVADLSEPPTREARPTERAIDAVRADQIFAGLSERERLVVAYWEEPVREFAPRVGLGKSQASAARQRVVDVLKACLTGDDNPDGVLGELVARAKEWAEGRTGEHDATSG
jgi:hypothetical protein